MRDVSLLSKHTAMWYAAFGVTVGLNSCVRRCPTDHLHICPSLRCRLSTFESFAHTVTYRSNSLRAGLLVFPLCYSPSKPVPTPARGNSGWSLASDRKIL